MLLNDTRFETLDMFQFVAYEEILASLAICCVSSKLLLVELPPRVFSADLYEV